MLGRKLFALCCCVSIVELCFGTITKLLYISRPNVSPLQYTLAANITVQSRVTCYIRCARTIGCNFTQVYEIGPNIVRCSLIRARCIVSTTHPSGSQANSKFQDIMSQDRINSSKDVSLVGKVCQQSSTFVRPGNNPMSCTYAIDGNRGHHGWTDLVSITDLNQPYPWWQVNLNQLKVVTNVMVYNRGDYRPEELDLFTIQAQFKSMPDESRVEICVSDVPYAVELIRSFNCMITGRYVVVKLNSANTQLTLAEVRIQVMGS